MGIHSGNRRKKIVLMFFLASAMIVLPACEKISMNEPVSVQNTSFAMGTAITSTLYGRNRKNAESAQEQIGQRLTEIDNHISWRINASITNTFNHEHRAAAEEYEDVFSLALDVAGASGGAFDPTVLSVSELWDIGGENQRHPSDGEIETALRYVDYEQVSLEDGILYTENTELKLELGAIGKGYALDQAAALIDRAEITGGILDAGSSILTFGIKPDGTKFRVGLRNPRGSQDDLIGIFNITDTAISTSGDYEKYFEEEGQRYHHIMDARTGKPADSGLMSVTVISGNSALCDALSTAAFILGLDGGMKLLENYGVMGIFIDNQKNVYYNDEEILNILSFEGEEKGYVLQPFEQ